MAKKKLLLQFVMSRNNILTGLIVDEQKKLWRGLLFSSTNMHGSDDVMWKPLFHCNAVMVAVILHGN